MGGGSLNNMTTTGLISIKSTPSTQYVRKGHNKVHVLVEVVTEAANIERAPIDLALVLDRSGSMSGYKLKGAKKAVQHVVRNLHLKDKVHFVTYDDKIDVVFANGDLTKREELCDMVKRTRPGGMTNMSGGLTQGHDLLKEHKSDDNVQQRVFVFSDGLANEGITSDEGLWNLVKQMKERGVDTSAFGIGDNFSEKVMQGIAEHGGGDYCFLKGEDSIPKHVRRVLRGLLNQIGTNSSFMPRGLEGSRVEKIIGYDDPLRGAFLGDVRESNHKQLVLEMDVFVPENAQPGSTIRAMQYEYSFKPAENPLDSTSVNGVLDLFVTADDALINAETEDKTKVDVALKILETSEADDAVVDLLDKGKVEEAVARKKETLDGLREWEDKDETGFVKAMVKRAEKTLKEMTSPRANVSRMRKCVDYEAGMERAMSAASICYDSESDDEAFSDDGDDDDNDNGSFTGFRRRGSMGSISIGSDDTDEEMTDDESLPGSPCYSPPRSVSPSSKAEKSGFSFRGALKRLIS